MSKKREELQDELQRIEYRVLRPRGPGAKENKPADDSHNNGNSLHLDDSQEVKHEDVGRKRDKFAMDVDKDDSDDDRHDEMEVQLEDSMEEEPTVKVAKEVKEEKSKLISRTSHSRPLSSATGQTRPGALSHSRKWPRSTNAGAVLALVAMGFILILIPHLIKTAPLVFAAADRSPRHSWPELIPHFCVHRYGNSSSIGKK